MGMYSPDPPDPPDYAAATTEGVKTEASLLAFKKRLEAASRMGKKITYKDPVTGEEKVADFTGIGDIDQTREELDFAGESADSIAKSLLDIRRKYGPEFVKQSLEELELSDPQFRKVRDALGKAALEDVEAGYKLAPGMRDEVQQATRAAQMARGNYSGAAPAAEEAFEVGNAAFRLRQQRLANAASYLAGTTPVAQFGQIAGAQQGAAPFQPMGIRSGIGLDPNAGARSLGLAQGVYNNQFQDYMNRQGQGASMLGSVAGLGLGAMTGGLLGSIGGNFGKGALGVIGGKGPAV